MLESGHSGPQPGKGTVMSDVSSLTAFQPGLAGLQPPDNGGTPVGSTDGTVPTTGIGIAGNPGPAPDAATAAASGAAAGLQAMLASITAVAPKISNDDLEARLAAILEKTKDLLTKADDEHIKTAMSLKQKHIEERKQDLAKAETKQVEAAHHHKKKKIWQKVKLAFEIVGAVTAIVVGTALVATGVGAVAGGMLIAVGVVSLVMIANDQMKEHSKDGLGMAGQLARDLGADPKACSKADFGFQIALAAITLLMSAALFVVPGGQAVAVADAAEAGETLAAVSETATAADDAATVAEDANDVAVMSDVAGDGEAAAGSAVARTDGSTSAVGNSAESTAGATPGLSSASARTGANLMNAAAVLGSTAGTVGEAVENFQEQSDLSDAKKFQALAKANEASMKALDDEIDVVMANLRSAQVAFSKMMDALVDAVKDEGKTATHMKFVG